MPETLTVLHYKTTAACESCEISPLARGVLVREIHIVGKNGHVFPELILCSSCENQLCAAMILGEEEP